MSAQHMHACARCGQVQIHQCRGRNVASLGDPPICEYYPDGEELCEACVDDDLEDDALARQEQEIRR